MCCYPAGAAATVLLLAAAVRHRVPDGALCCCGLLHLIPVFYFSSFIQTRFIFDVPIGSTVACTASIYLYPITHHTCSKITGMRGAKAGGTPWRGPPCKYVYRYVGHVVSAIEKSDLDQVWSR